MVTPVVIPITGSETKTTTAESVEAMLDARFAEVTAEIGAIATGLLGAGNWDASSGSFPSGSVRGTYYVVSVAGTVDGQTFAVDDWLIPFVDNASTSVYAANWFRTNYSQILPLGIFKKYFASVAALKADATAFSEGDLVYADGHRYLVANPSSTLISAVNLTGHHISSVGAKFFVLPGSNGFEVRAFGGIGDGAADDSVSATRAFWAAVSRKVSVDGISNDVGLFKVYYGAGNWRIAQPRAMMNTVGAGRMYGLTFEGEAKATTITFDLDDDDYLLYNNNEFLGVRFKNLAFLGKSDDCRFLYTTANGGAQDVLFDDCDWNGTWKNLFLLEGVNNNSEMKWSNCSITASIRDVVFEVPAVGTSDQFLNYWWVNCKLWLYDGQMIRAHKGGHFRFTNCDWSGLAPGMTLNNSTNGAPLFELLGGVHSRGVCSFSVMGGRIEHKNLLSKLIYCEWQQGAVTFQDVDGTSSIPEGYGDVLQTVFDCGNGSAPNVLFSNCDLAGKQKFINGIGSFKNEHNAKYELTTFRGAKPDDFFEFERTSNTGGTWLVELDRCHGGALNDVAGQIVLWDLVLGARLAMNSHHGERAFVLRGADGAGTPLTTGVFSALMPVGSLITRVTFRSSGAPTSTAVCDFHIRDGAGTSIANSGDQRLDLPWAVDVPLCFDVLDGNETITLTDDNGIANQSTYRTFVEVRFIS